MKIKTIPFTIQPEGKRYYQLYEAIKSEILNGHMKQNDQLPSIRSCVKQLNLSKTTVENAYQQLLMEGYIRSHAQSGYFVDVDEASAKLRKKIMQEEKQPTLPMSFIDLRSSSVDAAIFDAGVWLHYLKEVLHEDTKIMSYGDPQGELLLRRALQKYAYAMRGVLAKEESIVIGASFQSLLYLICSLHDGIKTVGFEQGGFIQAEQVFRDCGYEIIYLDQDEEGICMEDLNKHTLGLLYINSASCGTKKRALPTRRRNALLAYASEHHVLILEDDHNGELRYQTKMRPAMQGFDTNGQVIYIRSFSKLLLPSIRMSFMVLNEAFHQIYQLRKHNYNPSASKIEQLAFAHYLMDGHMEKQVRRYKRHYEARCNSMMQAIKKELPDLPMILDESALQILLELPNSKQVDAYVQAAYQHHILIQTQSLRRLALSFASVEEQAIPTIVHTLKLAWNNLTSFDSYMDRLD